MSGEIARRTAPEPGCAGPMHCAGIETIHRLERRRPGRILYDSVGSQYEPYGSSRAADGRGYSALMPASRIALP